MFEKWLVSDPIKFAVFFFFPEPRLLILILVCQHALPRLLTLGFPDQDAAKGHVIRLFLHARLVDWYMYLVTTYIHDFKTLQEPNKAHNGASLQLEVLAH